MFERRGFPKKEEREKVQKALEHNKKLAEKPAVEGGYHKDEKEWDMHDSPMYGFEHTFKESLPNWLKLEEDPEASQVDFFKKYIEKTLSEGEQKRNNLTAVEFGGPGSKLFQGFSKNFFIKTVGVCLKDIRNEGRKTHDKANKHSIIEGDILDVENDELSKKITKAIGTEKTDLIISRMEGPLVSIDKHPAILDRIIRNWYSMLNKNGLMFIQFELPKYQPRLIEPLVKQWSDVIKENFPAIDIQIDGGVMRLHKREGAPEELPPATQLFRNT